MDPNVTSPGSPNCPDPDTAATVSDSDNEVEVPETLKLTNEDLERLRTLTVEQINQVDKTAEEAVRAFFDNRVEDAENGLARETQSDPMLMLGLGLICFLRYCLSMEQPMADTALRTISEASAFASQIVPSGGNFMYKGFSKMGGAFRKKKDPRETWLSAAEFRAKSLHAMAQCLRTFCLILEQSVSSVVKAGFALNRGNKDLAALLKERAQRLEVLETSDFAEIGLDRNTPYNVEFVYGCIQTVVAILPSSVRSLLSIIGVSGDQEKGLEMITRCRDSDTLMSSFASATLLGFDGVLPSVCALAVAKCLPRVRGHAEFVLNNETSRNSLLHRWLIARVHRLTRDVPGSSERLQECIDLADGAEQINRSMPQLRNFVRFDQGWSFLLQRQWEKTIALFKVLVTESKWSDMFYIYAQGCCYEMMAYDIGAGSETARRALLKQATERYWTAMHQKQTKLGGKVMRVDQLTLARLSEMMKTCDREDPNPAHKDKLEVTDPLPEDALVQNEWPLPGYELHILFSLTHQVNEETMLKIVRDAESVAVAELEETRKLAVEHPAHGGAAVEKIAKAMLSADLYGKVPGTEMTHKLAAGKKKPRAYSRMLALAATKAFHLANAEDEVYARLAMVVLDAILAGHKYEDKESSFSFIVPFALYEKASLVTRLDGKKQGTELFDKYKKEYGSSRYYYHSLTENKVHMARIFALKD